MDRQELESSLYEIFRELLIRKESENTKVTVGMQNSLFVSSLNIQEHPMRNVKKNLRMKYYNVLRYVVLNQNSDEFVRTRLSKYGMLLIGSPDIEVDESTLKADINAIVNCQYMPWRKKYRYGILCDIALILVDKERVAKAYLYIASFIQKSQQNSIAEFYTILNEVQSDITRFLWSENLISQVKSNWNFFGLVEKRIIVSATMSAGKSTLINAIIGKKIAKTSQEVCTGNTCYIYNKPFEDNTTYLSNEECFYDATESELENISWQNDSRIATYFRTPDTCSKRVCLIDTPGVNSAINRNHGRITKKALTNEKYDKVIYVLNANKLGTEEEMAYLKWFVNNVDKDKVIFVLNKIDDFNVSEDNILESIEGVKKDLYLLGYDNPIICPFSAYFALLLKMKAFNEKLSDDEEDEYQLYVKKFSKPAYDLTKYYSNSTPEDADSELMIMSKRCGLYGLEKILFGGAV